MPELTIVAGRTAGHLIEPTNAYPEPPRPLSSYGVDERRLITALLRAQEAAEARRVAAEAEALPMVA